LTIHGEDEDTRPDEDAGAERVLEESAQQFRMLVQSVHDYAIFMLDPDGYVANWNPGAARIKGYKADEIVGRHFSCFYTEEDRARGEPARALAKARDEGKYEYEGLRQRKDGSQFWASVVIDPIRDDEGRLLGFAKITRDVTERRRAQEELERAREALAQAQKLEAVGRLTGGVAHDFNNMLTVIRASIDMLRQPTLPEAKRERYLTAIADTADRAARLTGQLLVFARRQPFHNEIFSVAERLERLKQIITTTLGSRVRLTFDLSPDSGTVLADPAQFETAILNMVINARDAMPKGGTLLVTARRAAVAPTASRPPATGPYAAISIADSGTGIEPNALSQIFEPFFTTKEVGKGTGLGLSQVYGFTRQSGGEITVDSVPGRGTTFTLYLPLMADDRVVPEREEAPAATTRPPAHQRILLVEDNEDVGTFATELLRELGQTVTWVRDASAALTALAESRDSFDLVFTDVVMPGDDGVTLAREIRRRWPDLRIILTSGYSHVLAEQGSHGFELLGKPYSLEALTAMLRQDATG